MNIQLSQYCNTCNQSNIERTLIKSDSKNRVACPECGAYTIKPKRERKTIKRYAPEEASYTVPEIVNPAPTISSRASTKKWPWKQYTEENVINLGIDLIAYVEAHNHLRAYDDFLNRVAHMSNARLERMAEQSKDLKESILIAKQMIAVRWKERWESDERVDINKIAPKFIDVFCALMREQQDKKLKIEHSVGQGIPYFDPTYKNFIPKD